MKVRKNFCAMVCSLFIGCLIPCLGQVDDDLTDETKALFGHLKELQKSDRFLFGQEFFNSYRHPGNAHDDATYSDAKSVVGHHPAVLGSDFHYYQGKHRTEKRWHTEAVKYAYNQGYVITFDWHLSARGTSTYKHSKATSSLVKNIIKNENDDRAWLLEQLDTIIHIINNDLVVDGVRIPIVFRPWHEMNKPWFWWGSSTTTTAEFKALYQLTVTYIKERTNSVLFCWSPNAPFGDDYYPGDDYVDVVGIDLYEASISKVRTELGKLVDFAEHHNKIAVLAETGDRRHGENAPLYWNNVIHPGIVGDQSKKSMRIAWVLTWINARWSGQFVPHRDSPSHVKESFINFKNAAEVVFGGEDEMPSIYRKQDGMKRQ
jgi:hypothetical protein